MSLTWPKRNNYLIASRWRILALASATGKSQIQSHRIIAFAAEKSSFVKVGKVTQSQRNLVVIRKIQKLLAGK